MLLFLFVFVGGTILLMAFGMSITFVSYFASRQLLNSEIALKPNYSGRKIPSLGGIVVLISLLVTGGAALALPGLAWLHRPDSAFFVIVLGFGLIGLLDDLLGDKDRQGFKGHLSALIKGNITTGAIKLFGGPIVALIALAPSIPYLGYYRVLLSVVTISLVANLFNLFDLAPGRCCKYGFFVYVLAVILIRTNSFYYFMFPLIATCLILDVREKFMLGDVGANVLGAIAGLALTVRAVNSTLLIIAVIAFLLTLLSEFASFSKIIDAFLPLRLFDELGQTKERIAWKRLKRSGQ